MFPRYYIPEGGSLPDYASNHGSAIVRADKRLDERNARVFNAFDPFDMDTAQWHWSPDRGFAVDMSGVTPFELERTQVGRNAQIQIPLDNGMIVCVTPCFTRTRNGLEAFNPLYRNGEFVPNPAHAKACDALQAALAVDSAECMATAAYELLALNYRISRTEFDGLDWFSRLDLAAIATAGVVMVGD